MPFESGHKKSLGRPRGSLNRNTVSFIAVLESKNFCAASALMECYQIALEKFIDESKKEESGRISPMESQASKYLKSAIDTASEIASFVYPKLKAIEHSTINPLKDLGPQEKLQALKDLVKALEIEAKNVPIEPSSS